MVTICFKFLHAHLTDSFVISSDLYFPSFFIKLDHNTSINTLNLDIIQTPGPDFFFLMEAFSSFLNVIILTTTCTMLSGVAACVDRNLFLEAMHPILLPAYTMCCQCNECYKKKKNNKLPWTAHLVYNVCQYCKIPEGSAPTKVLSNQVTL